jgi:predicted DNA-binding protein
MTNSSMFRSSQRVTITLPFSVYHRIVALADDQGRSTSNLMAYLLERGIELLFPDKE